MVRTCKAHPLASCECEGACELLIATNSLDHFCPVFFTPEQRSLDGPIDSLVAQRKLDVLKDETAERHKVHVLHFGPWPTPPEISAALLEWLDPARLAEEGEQDRFVHRHATWLDANQKYFLAGASPVGRSALATRAPIPLDTRRALNYRMFRVACGSTAPELALATLMPGYRDGADPWCGREYPADLQVLVRPCADHKPLALGEFDRKVKGCRKCVWWRWFQLAHVDADKKGIVTPVRLLPEGVASLDFKAELRRLSAAPGGLKAAIAKSPRPADPALRALLASPPDVAALEALAQGPQGAPLQREDCGPVEGLPRPWWLNLAAGIAGAAPAPGNISQCCLFCNQACGHQPTPLLDDPWADHPRDKWGSEGVAWTVGGPRREWWALEAAKMGALGLARIFYVLNLHPARRANPRPLSMGGVHYGLRSTERPLRLARDHVLDLGEEEKEGGEKEGGGVVLGALCELCGERAATADPGCDGRICPDCAAAAEPQGGGEDGDDGDEAS